MGEVKIKMAPEREVEGKMRGIAQSIRELWKGKADVDVGFRTIRTSWMVLVVAGVFTLIISPYMLLTPLYQSHYSFIGFFVFICVVAWLGDRFVGKKFVKKYFIDEIIKHDEKHELPQHDLLIARISIFILVPLILIMDGLSVAAESYYYVYRASVTLLVITTMLLVRSITKMKKRGRE